MRVAVRDDQHFAGCINGIGSSSPNCTIAFALGDEVIAHEPLGSRREHLRYSRRCGTENPHGAEHSSE